MNVRRLCLVLHVHKCPDTTFGDEFQENLSLIIPLGVQLSLEILIKRFYGSLNVIKMPCTVLPFSSTAFSKWSIFPQPTRAKPFVDVFMIGWILQLCFIPDEVPFSCQPFLIASYDMHGKLQCYYSLLPLWASISYEHKY